MSDQSLSLHDAPAISGLTFRYYHGPEDFPDMVAVYDACRPVDGYEWPTSVDDLARTFRTWITATRIRTWSSHRSAIDVRLCPWQLVSRGGWHDSAWIYWTRYAGLAPPGIGRAILRWTEERQRKVAREQTETGPHLFQVETQDNEQGMANGCWAMPSCRAPLVSNDTAADRRDPGCPAARRAGDAGRHARSVSQDMGGGC